jgi:hypothetical protein
MIVSTVPEYTVKESPRAKHARLKLSMRDGLVVVVPRGFDRDRIPGILEKKKQWLERAQEKIHTQQKFFEPEPPGKIPERLSLRGIGEEYAVDYRPTESTRVTAVERSGRRLLVHGDTDNPTACKAALRRWLNRKMHDHVAPWLTRLAEERGFQVHRVLVKSQRTRWGSCSRHGTISLNIKLLFIPEDLIRYVLLHELCHTVHLNHSREFWALLKERDPDFRQKDQRLRTVWRYVPPWLDSEKMCPEI